MAGLVRHRQTKEPVTDRPRLNHRATSRLYSNDGAAFQANCVVTDPPSAIPTKRLTSRDEKRASYNV